MKVKQEHFHVKALKTQTQNWKKELVCSGCDNSDELRTTEAELLIK